MHIGALIFPTDLSIRPDRLAIELETSGLRVALGDRAHPHPDEPAHAVAGRAGAARGVPPHTRPVRRADGRGDGDRAPAASAPGITLVAQHDPIVLAKTIASLDLLSGGRVLLGIGVGWNEDEMEHHGVDPKRRRSVAREHVLAMRELWTQEEASFDGEHVTFAPSWSWPKPVSDPHPPILMGGAGGPVTFRHVVEYCDGWMPIHGRRGIADKLDALRRPRTRPGGTWPRSSSACSAARPTQPSIEHYAELGFSRCVFGVPPTGEDDAMRALDRAAGVVADDASD